MKIFFLLTFCFTIALAPMASAAQKQDEAKAVKNRRSVREKHPEGGPESERLRATFRKRPKFSEMCLRRPLAPRIQSTQPKVTQYRCQGKQPVTHDSTSSQNPS